MKGQWRVDPTYLDGPFRGRVAILSPLDRLIFDRKRMVEIFEFDYQLEMYKPAAKRRWGYWAMPILYGDRLVGKVDATTDRKRGVLQVDAIHEDVPFAKTLTDEVARELADLAAWLDVDAPVPPCRLTRRFPRRPSASDPPRGRERGAPAPRSRRSLSRPSSA